MADQPATLRGRPLPPGNRGRPKGAKNKRTLANEAIGGQLVEVFKKLVEDARGGDKGATRLIRDLLPIRRSAALERALQTVGSEVGDRVADLEQSVGQLHALLLHLEEQLDLVSGKVAEHDKALAWSTRKKMAR